MTELYFYFISKWGCLIQASTKCASRKIYFEYLCFMLISNIFIVFSGSLRHRLYYFNHCGKTQTRIFTKECPVSGFFFSSYSFVKWECPLFSEFNIRETSRAALFQQTNNKVSQSFLDCVFLSLCHDIGALFYIWTKL